MATWQGVWQLDRTLKVQAYVPEGERCVRFGHMRNQCTDVLPDRSVWYKPLAFQQHGWRCPQGSITALPQQRSPRCCGVFVSRNPLPQLTPEGRRPHLLPGA